MFYRREETTLFFLKKKNLSPCFYMKLITVDFDHRKEYIDALCGQKAGILNVSVRGG
jgi:hypothetical protein